MLRGSYRSYAFQPTLPARGATQMQMANGFAQAISTHAPRTGSDRRMHTLITGCLAFQPTLPARGATCRRDPPKYLQDISTHAPRTGSDKFAGSVVSFCRISTHAPRTGSDHAIQRGSYGTRYFNPRSPHGERLYFSHTLIRSERFQPTLPARGATCRKMGMPRIYPHFNPRSPHGERPGIVCR